MAKEINIYEPNQRGKVGFFKIWPIMFKNIVKSRELIWQLFKRDFLNAYKKSWLGMSWILISPVIGIVSWVFMNMTGILKPGDVGIPYPAYVLLSSSIWGLFMGFYKASTGTLSSAKSFILQVKYPHEALLIKQTAQKLANFSLGLILNLAVLIYFGIIPSWKIIFLPIAILPMYLLASGVGLVISIVKIVAIDLTKGFNFAFGLLMYITPVIYSPNVENEFLKVVIKYNPLTYLIGNVRDMIIYGEFPHWDRFLMATVFAAVVFMISWKLFYVSEEKVIEKIA
jgi:lipopolysaccharide transport system permease protein